MLPDVSNNSITVASRMGVINTICGLAKAMHNNNKPKPNNMGGRFLVSKT
jgi:hypothetical protein